LEEYLKKMGVSNWKQWDKQRAIVEEAKDHEGLKPHQKKKFSSYLNF
jgi:hypothetical protein